MRRCGIRKRKKRTFSKWRLRAFRSINNKIDAGYPKKLKKHWHGIPFSQIDAAFWYPKKAKVYFFRNDKYVRYNPESDKVDPGYPKKTKKAWKGVPFNKIDAVFWYPQKEKVYFFSGNEYVRFDPVNDQVDDGYPRKISDNWKDLDKLATDNFNSAFYYPPKDRIYFSKVICTLDLSHQLAWRLAIPKI